MRRINLLIYMLFLSIFTIGQTNYTSTRNYVVEKIYIDPTKNNSLARSVSNVTYLDGLGRKLQEIQVGGAPGGSGDIIQHHVYGVLGRVERKYLPYNKTGNNGAFDSNAANTSNWNIYGPAEAPYTFTRTDYDNSPLDRIVKQTGPGKNWHVNQRGVTTTYGMNKTNEVKLYQVSEDGTLTLLGNYAAGSLQKVTVNDEDGKQVETYTDNMEQTVLTVNVESDNNRLETYRVYDDRGRLRYVLSPETSVRVGTTATRTTLEIRQYCYYYEYDKWGRQTLKQLPGCDPIYMVYDNRDRLVMSQDGKQRAENEKKWSYSLYDKQNRVIETGEVILTNMTSHATLQANASASLNYTPPGSRTISQYMEYDTYTTYALPFIPTSGYSSSYSTMITGKVTTTRVRILDDTKFLTTTTYYDNRGRVIQTVSNNYLGYKSVVNIAYDFMGNVTKTREAHGYSSTGTDVLETVNSYDERRRLLSTSVKLNNGSPATTTYTYDAVGRLTGQKHGNLQETLAYNSRGWLTSKESTPFKMKLRYESPSVWTNACWNGNISEWEWQHGTNITMMYGFTYDGVNRLKGSNHYQRSGSAWAQLSGNTAYNENGLRYDKNSNILTLTRTGNSAATQSYSYNGNQLTSLTKNGTIGTYQYDENGNMINDSRKNLSLSYNVLNLLSTINTGTTRTATYTYLADGTKLKVMDGGGNGICYVGSLTYVINGNNTHLEDALFTGGRIIANSSTRVGNELRYFLTDHLGSVRVIVNQNGSVEERNDYYPFGGRYTVSVGNVDAGNRWKYNGKEEQTTGNLGWLDYGARMYDWELGRWFGMDPKIESDISTSGYAYCKGNPVLFIDPDGQMVDWYRTWDKSAYIWKDRQDPYLKIGGETYFNVGSTFSMSYGKEYYNYYQNALISVSNMPLNAWQTIFNNDNLLGGLLSNRSPLSRKYQQILFNTSIHNAQKDFLEHPVTQGAINTLLFVATGGIEGIASLGSLGKNLLGNMKIPVYRVYGGAARIDGWSWTPLNPKLFSQMSYRKYAGLPNMNWGTNYIKGSVKIKDILTFRKALPLDGNCGGLPEFIINPNNIDMWRYMKHPSIYK